MDSGRSCGGIFRLLELHEAHPAEFAYDFRSRFNLSFDDVGESISLLDAILLTAVLLRDPSSWLQAAENRWKFPVSPEWMVAAHTYDLLARVNSKNKPKPYPTPYPADGTKRIGSTRTKTRAEVISLLDRMNPKET